MMVVRNRCSSVGISRGTVTNKWRKVEGDGWVAGGAPCLTEALKSCEGDARADPCTSWEEGMRDCAVCFAALGMGDIHPEAFMKCLLWWGRYPGLRRGVCYL